MYTLLRLAGHLTIFFQCMITKYFFYLQFSSSASLLVSCSFHCVCHWFNLHLGVGREKISQDGCSGSLAPRFVNNDYLTAEIIYSTAQAHHEVLAWLWVTSCGTSVWAPPKKSTSQVRILWWQLGPPGEELCYVRLCYGCSVNQERMNVSAVPMAPWVSFQPLARLVPCLPWVQRTVRTVRYSETTGARNRMKNNTTGIDGGYPVGRAAWGRRLDGGRMEEASHHYVACCHDLLGVGSGGRPGSGGRVNG